VSGSGIIAGRVSLGGTEEGRGNKAVECRFVFGVDHTSLSPGMSESFGDMGKTVGVKVETILWLLS
jgi:hypothetical protein